MNREKSKVFNLRDGELKSLVIIIFNYKNLQLMLFKKRKKEEIIFKQKLNIFCRF